MATFKELQDRTEAAEKMAQEAHARISEAEAERDRYKLMAEEVARQAEVAVRKAGLHIRQADLLIMKAEAAAQPYGFERNEWWEKVFLSVIGGGRSTDAATLVTFAAEIATKATLVRAGHVEALAQENLVLGTEKS